MTEQLFIKGIKIKEGNKYTLKEGIYFPGSDEIFCKIKDDYNYIPHLINPYREHKRVVKEAFARWRAADKHFKEMEEYAKTETYKKLYDDLIPTNVFYKKPRDSAFATLEWEKERLDRWTKSLDESEKKLHQRLIVTRIVLYKINAEAYTVELTHPQSDAVTITMNIDLFLQIIKGDLN